MVSRLPSPTSSSQSGDHRGILATIAREVPEYERPLEGRFGRGIRTAVNEALLQPVSLIRDPDAGCVFVSDPDGPGRLEQVQRAAGKATMALGLVAEPAGAAKSWEMARDLLVAASAGAVDGSGLLRAEDHLAELLLLSNRQVTALLAARRLAPLEELTERARERMQETALAYVRHHGNAVAMAAELHVHPQTARCRIARLRERFGEELDDPDFRFELEIALRA